MNTVEGEAVEQLQEQSMLADKEFKNNKVNGEFEKELFEMEKEIQLKRLEMEKEIQLKRLEMEKELAEFKLRLKKRADEDNPCELWSSTQSHTLSRILCFSLIIQY